MSEICANCPNPPTTPGACEGPVILIKEALEMKDFRGNDTARTQSIGSNAMKEICGILFTPDATTILEKSQEKGRPRYAVKVGEGLSKAGEEEKQGIMQGLREDIERRQDPSRPTPLKGSKPRLAEVKTTPGAQLWAELRAISSDESIVGLAYGCEEALDNAQDLINDALSTSQFQADTLAYCQAVREELKDVFVTEYKFKELVTTYLGSNADDEDGNATSVIIKGYSTWAQNRERLPVESSSEIAYLNGVVMQLARAVDTLKEGGFADLSHIAETRNRYFFEVSRGSGSDIMAYANSASAHLMLASSKALQAVHALLVKIDEIAQQLY